jgi:3-hydroxy-3-methylglutaryl CoA synthase
MVGITSCGTHIPWYRISHKTISSAMGWLNPATPPGEKAVANYDEDSITMAVAAGMDCLNNLDREKIDGLYFATNTSPYAERQGAGIIATALDLSSDIRIADFAHSTKAGTTALVSACEAVKAGAAKNMMLCASDCRLGKPGSAQEHVYGDGGAALLMGDSGVIASLEGYHSVSYDFVGHWRADGEDFERSLEDRFVQDEGHTKFISQAVSGLLGKYQLSIKDLAKVIYPSPNARLHAAIGRRLGAEPQQIQDPMLASVGDTGAAHPLMMLVAALEEAKPGDKLLVASYGSGSDALFFQVTKEIEKIKDRRGIKANLALRKELSPYEKYTAFRNGLPVEKGIRGEEYEGYFTPLTRQWRDRRAVLALCGSRCKRCGTPQYPPQRICVKPGCGAVDEMEPYPFSDKKGRVFTYTADHLAYSPSPPQIYGMINFEGGGRYWFDFTDCNADSLKVGMLVEMSFRRKYVDKARGIHTYFWKAIPARV